MDDSYSSLIENIMKDSNIKSFIDNEKKNGKFLNLIDSKWDEILANDCVYQRHLNNTNKKLFGNELESNICNAQFIPKDEDKFRLMVLIPCKIGNNYENQKMTFSIISQEQENLLQPLIKVAQVMTTDKTETHTLLKEFKFSAELCNFFTCPYCKMGCNMYEQQGYKIDININGPCFRNTFIHEGNKIKPINSQVLKYIFNGKDYFYMIGLVEIHLRIFFTRNDLKVMKVIGKIHKMLAIDPNNFIQTEQDPFFADCLSNLQNEVKVSKNISNAIYNPFHIENIQNDSNVAQDILNVIYNPFNSENIQNDSKDDQGTSNTMYNSLNSENFFTDLNLDLIEEDKLQIMKSNKNEKRKRDDFGNIPEDSASILEAIPYKLLKNNEPNEDDIKMETNYLQFD